MARINRNFNILGYIVCTSSGVLWPSIPTSIWLLPIVALLMVLFVTRSMRWATGLLIGFVIVIVHANLFIHKTEVLFEYGKNIIIQGKVISLYQSALSKNHAQGGDFIFEVEQINQQPISLAIKPKIQIFESQFSNKALMPQLGEQWHLSVVIQPIIGRLNDAGFDSERYYVSNSLSGKAVINPKSTTNYRIESSRSLRLWLYNQVVDIPNIQALAAYPYILALSFGERSEITDKQWQQLRESGLSHLMAISGLHIGLAMLVGWWFGIGLRLLCSQFSLIHIKRFNSITYPVLCFKYQCYAYLPIICSVSLAVFYAYLAGFSLPTERALMMGGAYLLAKALRLHWAGWQILLYALCMILALNPFSILQASFWLSFYAIVTIYLSFWFVSSKQDAEHLNSEPTYWRHKLVAILTVQLGIFIGLAPLTLIFFGGISSVSPFVNLLVIPWVSFITVPLLFLALILTALMNVLGLHEMDGIWQIIDLSLQPVLWILEHSHGHWFTLPSWFGYMLILITASFLLYRFACRNLITVIWLIAIMVWVFPIFPQPKWRIDVLDVGQGLAVLISQPDQRQILDNTHHRSVLYDTGVKWPDGSMAKSVLIPILHQRGEQQLDGLIISHTDVDHAGGRIDIENELKPKWKRSSEIMSSYQACIKGESWQWGALKFEVLWPPKTVKRAYNPHSCVVKVSDGEYSFLLTGDVDTISEILLTRQGQQLESQIMLVPHHGSKTSSSNTFIAKVNPQLAIASVSKNNQWHLPAQNIIERYKRQGVKWLDTGASGMISVGIYSDHWQVSTMRGNQYEPWYRQIIRNGLQ